MKNSDENEDVLCQTCKCHLKKGENSCWIRIDYFKTFAQRFGFASRKAKFWVREFHKYPPAFERN